MGGQDGQYHQLYHLEKEYTTTYNKERREYRMHYKADNYLLKSIMQMDVQLCTASHVLSINGSLGYTNNTQRCTQLSEAVVRA